MYESFYGLKSKPFQLTPDPSFYFGSRQHSRAMSYLEYGLQQHEGFVVITGEVGAGKTTIARALMENLDQGQFVTAHLISTQLDADDVLRMVCAAFRLPIAGLSKSELLTSLEAFLIGNVHHGRRCLLVVDDAQNLSNRAVEELRMLSNFQERNESLLQIFMIGQPEFRRHLENEDLTQFRQRVIAACHIGPLDEDETVKYIDHRLHCAGATTRPVLREDAYRAVHRISGGVPRRINAICDRLLLFGYLEEQVQFSGEDVDNVAREMWEETWGAVGQGAPAPVERLAGRQEEPSAEVQPVAPPGRSDGAVLIADMWEESRSGRAAVPAPAPQTAVPVRPPVSAAQARPAEPATGDPPPAGDRRKTGIEGAVLGIEQGQRRLERSLLRLERLHTSTLELLQRLLEERAEDRLPPPGRP
jgi:putative secretion ATPase (PEP-CTERM system associated)